jgi:hypothetical protein
VGARSGVGPSCLGGGQEQLVNWKSKVEDNGFRNLQQLWLEYAKKDCVLVGCLFRCVCVRACVLLRRCRSSFISTCVVAVGVLCERLGLYLQFECCGCNGCFFVFLSYTFFRELSHLVLEKQTKCIPICMSGSSFIHIVDKSE